MGPAEPATHPWGRRVAWAAVIVGALAGLLGGAFVAMYVLEAIVARAGEPDQSLLFWYLPILFLGLAGLVIGLGMGTWGVRRLRRTGGQSGRQ